MNRHIGNARSTPLRLTKVLLAIFTTSMFFSYISAFVVIWISADSALHLQVLQEFHGLELTTSQTELEQRLVAQIGTIPPESLILVYQADDGRRLASLPYFPVIEEFEIVDEKSIGETPFDLADSYLAVSGRVGKGTLVLARNREQVSELVEIFTSIFLISLLPTLAIAGAAGWFMARNIRERVEDIRSVLFRLTSADLDARIQHFPATPDDLSEIGHAVNTMAAAQSASMSSLRQISADIAHDLKTPIQSVSVLLEQLGAAETLSARQLQIVDQARAQTDQIVKTFQSLLHISQLEGGAAHQHFVALDLLEVVVAIVEVYEPSAEKNGQFLTFSPLTGGPFIVQGERNLLGQVLANLLENALRYSGPGTEMVVSLAVEEGHVVLRCNDTGPGIPLGERRNVLRRLYRLDRSRASEGSGLGLSLVAAICELHGANLLLSDNGPGLAVEIRFPSFKS